MEYSKTRGGKWVNAEEIADGALIKIVEEVVKQDSQFKDKEGMSKTENVGKVRVQGAAEAVNMRFNWTTIYALVDAFGKDSKAWIGKVLTVRKREMLVGDTVRDVLYLIPEGFDLVKNEERKLEIRRIDTQSPEDMPQDPPEEEGDDGIPF